MSLDLKNSASVRAEALRRRRNLEAGRAPGDDGYAARPVPAGAAGWPFVVLTVAQREYRFTLPWSCVVSDNKRLRLSFKQSKGYKLAFEKAQASLREQIGPGEPFAGRVALHITITEPDRHPRDIGNFVKMLGDALTEIAYDDDSLIDQLTVTRATPNVDAPHVELIVTELGKSRP